LIDGERFGWPDSKRYWVLADRMAPIGLFPKPGDFACFAYRK